MALRRALICSSLAGLTALAALGVLAVVLGSGFAFHWPGAVSSIVGNDLQHENTLPLPRSIGAPPVAHLSLAPRHAASSRVAVRGIGRSHVVAPLTSGRAPAHKPVAPQPAAKAPAKPEPAKRRPIADGAAPIVSELGQATNATVSSLGKAVGDTLTNVSPALGQAVTLATASLGGAIEAVTGAVSKLLSGPQG